MPGLRRHFAFLLGAAALTGVVSPAAAQTPGLPVFAGGAVPGVEIGAALGLAPAQSPVGHGLTWVGTVDLALRRASLRLVAGALDRRGASPPQAVAGAMAAVRALDGGVESPLSLDLFAGHGRAGGEPTGSHHTVAGLACVLTLPTPVLALRPWLAPRVDWRTTSSADGSRVERAIGGSAGVDLRFLGGLVLRAAWDTIADARRLIGFGAGYHF